MPILKGSVTLSRFKVERLPENIPALLRQFAFVPIDDIAEERAFGWTNFDDMLDTEWKKSVPEKEPYIVFSLRLDTRRIAPATLAKERKIALEAEQERIRALGKKFIARDRKKEIAEQVRLLLLTKTIPTPACFEAVWNPATGIVLLGSASHKIQNMFCEIFARTFEETPVLLTPYEMAADFLPKDRIEELNNLPPADFSGAQNATDVSPEISHILSEEFLTWAWYRAWTAQQVFSISGHSVTIGVNQPASVQHFNGASRNVASVRGDDLNFAELFKGLQEGKKVCGLTLSLEIDGASYSVHLSYPDLLLRSARLPAVAKDSIGDDPDGLFLERTYLIETLYSALDLMFGEFAALRVSNDWKAEEEKIREWIRKR